MANCRWKIGCIVYWGVVIFSTTFLVVLHFQGQYVIPTDAYLSCEYLLKAIFAIIIIFTIISVGFTKSKVKEGVMPVLIFTMAVGLLVLSVYTLFLLETVMFPNIKDAVEIVRKRYAFDQRVLADIQTRYKCCGLRNYADWHYFLLSNENLGNNIHEKNQTKQEIELKIPLQIVPSSCCKLFDHCGVHLRDEVYQGGDEITSKFKISKDPTFNQTAVLEEHVYTTGCYKQLKINSKYVYEAMRVYTCTAFVFVSLVTLVFAYYWWRTRVEAPEPKGWPAPPMNVKSIVYDSQKGNIIAYIDPFMDSVLSQEGDDNGEWGVSVFEKSR